MMSVLEYAIDVDMDVKDILDLCKKLNISVNSEEDMLSDDDIILLDNEIENNSDDDSSNEDTDDFNEDEFDDSYDEELNEVKIEATVKKKNKISKVEKKNDNNFAKQKKEMYKHKEKLQSNLNTLDDSVVLYTDGMNVADFANVLGKNYEY